MGERLYYVAAWRGQWLALLVFCATAKHLRHREKWIGWTEAQRRKRLGLVTNNARFLILPHGHYPNLATRVMGLCSKRLPQDWQARYAHPVVAGGEFCGHPVVPGARPIKPAGWTELGPTQGYGRSQQDYYVKHDRPKALFVKELSSQTPGAACAPTTCRRAGGGGGKPGAGACQRCAWGELRSLCAHFASVPDFRGRVESYPLSGALAMVACAHLCEAPRGHRDLKAFARRFTQAQRRVLGWWRDPKTYRYPSPEQSHFWTGVAGGGIRSGWKPRCWTGKDRVRGSAPPGQLLAADGKELRHAQGAQVVTLTQSYRSILSRQPVGRDQIQ